MDYAAVELRRKQTKKYANKQMKKVPFKQSNRFYRGRIIDRLREGAMKEAQLRREFLATYETSENRVRKIIQSLERDGLIARTKGNVVRLPT